MRAFLSALALALLSPPSARTADLRHFDDAPLHGVHFINTQEGWAVGAEGVVWKTIDGGKTWERLPTGTRASLRGVHFINAFFGWAVGREELPHGQGSVGVALFTRDGGLKWEAQKNLESFPGFNQVRFADAQTGFMFGDCTELFPTGLIRTADGGKSWQPVEGPQATTWLDGRCDRGGDGMLVGAWSRFAKVRADKFFVGRAQDLVKDLGGRSLRGVAWLDRRALAVGQGGLVTLSDSDGSAWDAVNLNLPIDVLQALDFHAISGTAERAWAVGRPGSVVFHTPDRGKSWKVQRTGQPLPLNGVFFRDDLHGWAVGEAGTIVATVDGGHTWKLQKQGAKRAALLAVHARPADAPLDLLATLGGDEQYLSTALCVVSADPLSASPRLATQPARWSAAVRQVGGLAAESLWQFPLPQHLARSETTALTQYWNRLHDPRGDQPSAEKLLLRQLVLALRIWRPDAVITDPAAKEITRGAAPGLVADTMREAFKLAADPRAFPEQIEILGLQPWNASRLFALDGNSRAAGVTVDGNQPCPRLEATARQFAAPAAALLHDRPADLPAQRCLRLIEGKAPETLSHLLAAITTEARRSGNDSELDKAAVEAVRVRRQLEGLADNAAEPRLANAALAALAPALAKLPDEHGVAAAFHVANQYARKGQWLLARETFLLMVERYPAHPLAAEAYRWLIRHSSSSEARRRQELGQFLLRTETQPGAVQQSGLVQANFLADQHRARQWYRGSLEFGKRLSSFGAAHYLDPTTLFCLQSARRQLGEIDDAKKWYGVMKDRFGRSGWHDAAAAELWICQVGPSPIKSPGVCRFADQKPFLDGNFDDACWQNLKPMALANAVGETGKDHPTEARFAFDQEFLYVALRCKHPAGKRVPPVKPRQRDADLTGFDRVSLLIDLDRDYSTYFHLQVDQRGCVREECWGDVAWNPKWFVAVKSADDCWQIEAAIPLAELTGDRITPGTVWACNVVRTIPGRGVQGWSLPADVEPRPEGMGLLMFRDKQ